jgi:hypothetical protein
MGKWRGEVAGKGGGGGGEGGSGVTRQRPPEAARALRRSVGDGARRGRWSRGADMWARFDGSTSVDFSGPLVTGQFDGLYLWRSNFLWLMDKLCSQCHV